MNFHRNSKKTCPPRKKNFLDNQFFKNFIRKFLSALNVFNIFFKMVFKLWYNLLSQPSRSVVLFFKLNKIPYEKHVVNLLEGEHLSFDYAENVSAIQKVPVMHDGSFRLTESSAILR